MGTVIKATFGQKRGNNLGGGADQLPTPELFILGETSRLNKLIQSIPGMPEMLGVFDQDVMRGDIVFLASNGEYMSRVAERIDEIRAFLTYSIGFSLDSPLVIFEQGPMRFMDVSEIGRQVLLTDNRAAWMQHKERYGALVREYGRRIKQVQEIVDSQE